MGNPNTLTARQACEHIVRAGFLEKENGECLTAIEVYNYSPSGEMSSIFYWYKIACFIIGEPKQ